MILGVVAGVLLSQAQPQVVRLENGMRWLLVPRDEGGWVSGAVVVAAGGIDEEEGKTGAAHLLEHLAFKGTPVVGSTYGWGQEAEALQRVDELLDRSAKAKLTRNALEEVEAEAQLLAAEAEWRRYGSPDAFKLLTARHGIKVNANTSKDRTAYLGDFRASKLGVWLALEAQRFAAPVFRELRRERDVVLQELRDRQSEGGPVEALLCESAFAGTGYAWLTIGREEDLRTLSPSTLDAFYAAHYAPGNAVGVLVGSFEPAEAKKLLQRTFAWIPGRASAPRRELTMQPQERLLARTRDPMLTVAFARPSQYAPDAASWDVLQRLLSAESSPLMVIQREGLARDFAVRRTPGYSAQHLVTIHFLLAKGVSHQQLLQRFFELLAAWTPEPAEFIGARVALDRDQRLRQRDRFSFAPALGEALLLGGSFELELQSTANGVTSDGVSSLLRTLGPEKAWTVEGRP